MPDIKSALSAALLRAPAPVYTNPVVQQTINEWDDEDFKVGESFPINNSSVDAPKSAGKAKRGGQIKNNVMRETFDFIMNNPGLTCKAISICMEKKGFKASSVTSVVSQLWRSNQLIREGNTYRTTSSAYRPMKATPSAKISRLKKRVEELKEVAKSKGIAALPVQTEAVEPVKHILATPTLVHSDRKFDAKKLVDPLTVAQAREVYNELKTMFGG